MDKLKPCPFCGDDRVDVIEHKYHHLSNSYGCMCFNCKTESYQFFNSRKEAIEAWNRRVLQVQDVPGTNVGNMISRQAAIDIVRGYEERLNGYIGTPNDSEVYAFARGLILSIKRNICAVPPAQPEPTTEIQEILDYLDTTLHPIVSPDNWDVYAELHDMISSLSSAGPEIIRCYEWNDVKA